MSDRQMLEYLLIHYDLALKAHAEVQMDNPEDKALHARVVQTLTLAANPVREHLQEGDHPDGVIAGQVWRDGKRLT